MATAAGTNRRDRFRQYMHLLTTGAAPARVIEQGLYVPAPEGSAVAERLTARLELQPTSSHLVLGGIGTGKTTQLLITEKQLSELPDVLPIYVDVAAHQDLTQLKPGILTIVAGMALSGYLQDRNSELERKTREQFRKWAEGYTIWVDDSEPDDWHDGDDGTPVAIEGEIVPPDPPLDYTLKERLRALRTLLEATRTESAKSHIVLLLDSLDRISDTQVFGDVIAKDIRGLKELGFGLVVVGPLRVLFGTDRPITDRFDYPYQISAVDVSVESGPSFLKEVLRLRVPKDVLPDDPAQGLAKYSGGVIRDLLSLARSAGEEAYISGSDTVTVTDVAKAADAFGRTLMLGLGEDEIKTLQRVRANGTFVATSDKDIALLVTRRVLEYVNGQSKYAVHPTIQPLLKALANS